MNVSLVRSKRWRAPMVAATLAIFVAACGNTAPSSSTPKNRGTLSWALDSDADTLNPFVMSALSEKFAPFLVQNLVGYVAPASVYGKIDPSKMRDDPVSKAPTVFGGAYKLDKWIPGQEFDFSANTNYYNGRPHYDKVIAK